MNHTMKHHEESARSVFGFWIYIMTDCLLFASLFAVYVTMHGNTYGGPSDSDLFDLPFALFETLILLTSSFTIGLALLAAHRERKRETLAWLATTLVLGLSFLGLEFSEFSALVREGHDWTRSGFLSAFFTLVGTHGLHVLSGSIWMSVVIYQAVRLGLTPRIQGRMMSLALFWHFLDVIWIFIFTFVYLLSAV